MRVSSLERTALTEPDGIAPERTVPSQGRRDSNPQHAVLETAALPLELLPYGLDPEAYNQTRTCDLFLTKEVLYRLSYVGEVSSPIFKGASR